MRKIEEWPEIGIAGFVIEGNKISPKLRFKRYHHCGSFGYLATAHWSYTMMNEHVMYLKELFA